MKSLNGGPRPIAGLTAIGRRPTPRPPLAISTAARRAAEKWQRANLAGYELPDLERALEAVKKHPHSVGAGYSPAKDARNRLQLEINRRKALPKA